MGLSRFWSTWGQQLDRVFHRSRKGDTLGNPDMASARASLAKRRILALSLGNDELASSRVRLGSVLTALRSQEWDARRVSASRALWPAEFMVALLWFRPEVTVIQKIVPPVAFVRIVRRFSRRLVFDCDDAIHLGYDGNRRQAALFSRRLRYMLPVCDCVVTSNRLLEADLKQLGAETTRVFPGPAPCERLKSRSEGEGALWLGSPSTVSNVRSIVYPAFRLLPSTVELTVVGADRDFDLGQIRERVWSETAQLCALSRARVGLAPQAVDDWSQRKAFYKVLEYLAAGLIPVVPAHPAVRTLLGEELERLAITAANDTPEAWATAISKAMDLPPDQGWMAARSRVFARWSAASLGRVVVGD